MARSPQQRGISIRLSLEDAARVKAELERLGIDGGAALQRIEASAAPASVGLRAVNTVAAEGRGVMEGYARQLGPVGSGLLAFGPAGLAAGAGIAAVTAGLSAGLSVLRDYERLEASLTTVTGSATAAAAAFDRVRAFAAETPYAVEEVTAAFIKLKALGLDPSDAALRSYGNTASGMSKSLDQMIEAVADATTGEFERLKEFGIRASTEGNRITFTFRGISTTVQKEAASIEDYLRKIGEVQFAGGMERQAKTLDGAISNLTDSWREFLAEVAKGSGARDAVGWFIPWLTDVLKHARAGAEWLHGSQGPLQEFLDVSQRLDEARARLGGARGVARVPAEQRVKDLEAEQAAAQQRLLAAATAEAADSTRDKSEADAAAAAKAAERAAAIAKVTKEQDRELELARLEKQVREERAAADKAEADLRKEVANANAAEVAGVRARAVAIVRAERETAAAVESRNRALAESAKLEEGMFLSQADADAILDNIQKQTVAYRDLIASLDLEIEKKTELAGLQGLDQESRATEVALIEAKYKAIADGRPLDEAELAAIRERVAAITSLDAATVKAQKASEEAAREYQRIWDKALDNVQDSFRDTFRDALDGNLDDTRSFVDAARSLLLDMIADVTTAMVFRPAIMPVVSGVAGAIGDATGIQVPSGAGGVSGAGGGFGDLLGVGSSVNSMLSGGSTWLNNIGAQIGFANPLPAGVAGPPMPGTMFGGTSLSGFLGGMGVGTTLATLLGLGSGNMLLDSGAGLAGAALGQLLIPIPGVGAGVGAFAGTALAGLFGKKKPTVGPNAYAQTNLAGGAFLPWETGADNGGDAAALVDLSAQVGAAYQEILDGLGARVAADAEASFHLGNFPSQGGIWTMINDGRTPGGERQAFGDDAEAALADIIMGLFQGVDLEGVSAEMQDAIRTSAGLRTSIGEFTSDLELIKLLLDGDPFETESVTKAEQALKALGDRFDELAEQATELGLPLDVLEQKRAEAAAALTTGFEESIAAQLLAIQDPLAAALQAFDKSAEEQRREAEALGADMVALEELQALQRQQVVERYGQGITEALRRSLADAATAIETGSGSALAAGDRLAIAEADWQAALAAAQGGDQAAAARLAQAGQTFLGLSATVNTRGSVFAADQDEVVAALRALAGAVSPVAGVAGLAGANDNDPAAAVTALAETQHRAAVDRALNQQIVHLAAIELNTERSADRLGRIEAGQGRMEALLADIAAALIAA